MRASVLIACLVLGAGCQSATAPDSSGLVPVFLVLRCATAGPGVSCQATYSGGQPARDVGTDAEWVVEPSTRLAATTPGQYLPRDEGEVSITARLGYHGSRLYEYLVAPGRDAKRLESFLVYVRDAATGNSLGGARVSIVSGYKAGASCLTNTHGACDVPRLLNGEQFGLQVEHAGYELLTADYQFDVLSPTGGRNSYLARLVRKP